MRGATPTSCIRNGPSRFQSTLPMRGATWYNTGAYGRAINFNPRSPCGERLVGVINDGDFADFNPRSPCGERQNLLAGKTATKLFQSTLPMRGATAFPALEVQSSTISIHAPHAGSDLDSLRLMNKFNRFQSTLPMRGATFGFFHFFAYNLNFNPRSPCGERLGCFRQFLPSFYFNPRSPCGERPGVSFKRRCFSRFQSTLPMRGATWLTESVSFWWDISIHAPHAGSDPSSHWNQAREKLFQSTLPMRGATGTEGRLSVEVVISIHAPHAGSD